MTAEKPMQFTRSAFSVAPAVGLLILRLTANALAVALLACFLMLAQPEQAAAASDTTSEAQAERVADASDTAPEEDLFAPGGGASGRYSLLDDVSALQEDREQFTGDAADKIQEAEADLTTKKKLLKKAEQRRNAVNGKKNATQEERDSAEFVFVLALEAAQNADILLEDLFDGEYLPTVFQMELGIRRVAREGRKQMQASTPGSPRADPGQPTMADQGEATSEMVAYFLDAAEEVIWGPHDWDITALTAADDMLSELVLVVDMDDQIQISNGNGEAIQFLREAELEAARNLRILVREKAKADRRRRVASGGVLVRALSSYRQSEQDPIQMSSSIVEGLDAGSFEPLTRGDDTDGPKPLEPRPVVGKNRTRSVDQWRTRK